MGNDLNPFQVFILLLFAALALGGVIFFAAFRSMSGESESAGRVVIWGTIDGEMMTKVLNGIKQRSRNYGGVQYVEKEPSTFSSEYISALAESRAPDLILLPHDLIFTHQATITLVPFSSYPLRTFKDTFVEGTELYVSKDGVYGIPFTLDPLVLYWNRTYLANKGMSQPPRYWDEVLATAPKLTEKDELLNVRKSAIALGEFSNITHAKDILSTLLLQAGSKITAENSNGRWGSVLEARNESEMVPAQDALRYFTEFSNPTKSVYSWNKSLPEAKQAFANGDLALYIGYASEAEDIQKANPNLNYDIAALPQTREDETASVFARFTALAVPKGAPNSKGALKTAFELTSAETQREAVNILRLPPVRRDLLATQPEDPYLALFFRAAILAEAWLDPSPRESGTILRTMADSVTTNRNTIPEAVDNADRQLEVLFK